MKTYRIAFLTCDWNYELVESTLRGLKDYVAEHENVYLRIFDCFGKDQGTEAGCRTCRSSTGCWCRGTRSCWRAPGPSSNG